MDVFIPNPEIPDVKVVTPKKHGDHRGFFSETYTHRAFSAAGVTPQFVQDNHAFSQAAGTIRGLHFQTPPYAQDKLVRVIRGEVLDVAVDLRHGSPTYGKHAAARLSADAWNQIFVPIGFAHGLLTLAPDTEVLYKVSNYYSPEHDMGLLWNDPALGIAWGIDPQAAQLSAKDKMQPKLADLPVYFRYEDMRAR